VQRLAQRKILCFKTGVTSLVNFALFPERRIILVLLWYKIVRIGLIFIFIYFQKEVTKYKNLVDLLAGLHFKLITRGKKIF